MATARMKTTPIERIEFRNALRMPRRSEFTVVLSEVDDHPSRRVITPMEIRLRPF
jgi:hypothetical protein